MIDNKK